jgi:hypothetical protein
VDQDRQLTAFMYSGGYQACWGAAVMLIFVNVALGAGFPVPFAGHPVLLNLLGAGIGFSAGYGIGMALVGGSGKAAQQVYMPNAWGTYVRQHSHIDTLEARGDYQGAVDAWEKLAIAEPMNPWPLIRSGELYLRILKEPQLAVERFRAARDLPSASSEQQIYASLKMIDLYLGPLNDRGRGLVELRRFSEIHAGSREADHARQAIARLKAEDAAKEQS